MTKSKVLCFFEKKKRLLSRYKQVAKECAAQKQKLTKSKQAKFYWSKTEKLCWLNFHVQLQTENESCKQFWKFLIKFIILTRPSRHKTHIQMFWIKFIEIFYLFVVTFHHICINLDREACRTFVQYEINCTLLHDFNRYTESMFS